MHAQAFRCSLSLQILSMINKTPVQLLLWALAQVCTRPPKFSVDTVKVHRPGPGCSSLPALPPIRWRHDLGAVLKAMNLTGPGAELGTHSGDYTEVLLKHWQQCSHYVQVDAWAHLDNYVDSANSATANVQAKRKLAAMQQLQKAVSAGHAKKGSQCHGLTSTCAKKIR